MNEYNHGLRASGVACQTGAEPTHPEGSKKARGKEAILLPTPRKKRFQSRKFQRSQKANAWHSQTVADAVTGREHSVPTHGIVCDQDRATDEAARPERRSIVARLCTATTYDDEKPEQFSEKFAAYTERIAGMPEVYNSEESIVFDRLGKFDGKLYLSRGCDVQQSTALQGDKRRRRLNQCDGSSAQHTITLTNHFDDCCLPDDVLAALPLP